MVGREARQQYQRVECAPAQLRWSDAWGPLVDRGTNVQIGEDGEGEHGPLDRDDSGRSPPHQTAMAKTETRQTGYIEAGDARAVVPVDHGRRSSSRCWAVSSLLGQNQMVSATADGISPHTTAQGVKIEPISSALTATALSRGHIVGFGKTVR